MAPIDESPLTGAAAEPELPIITELKQIDDQYLAVEREYEKELAALQVKYTELQRPLLEERGKKLVGDGASEEKTGTPACKGFWLKALQNHPAMQGEIESWDEPVLEYLKDVTVSELDQDDRSKGFRLRFLFAENPYFENALLSKEYQTKESSPYTGETDVEEILGCTIKWKAGKDVTVETVAKKAKKGAPKKKATGSKQEARGSFFRGFFRTMKAGGRLPDDVDAMQVAMACGADDDDMEEEDLLQMVMEQDHEVGTAIRDNIIPFAVRWYTGEAAPERDDEDDDEDEEEEEDDDDEESSEDESESQQKKGKKGGKKGAKPAKKETAAGGEQAKEECKQQ